MLSELIQFKAKVLAPHRINIPYEEAKVGDIAEGDFVQVQMKKLPVKERARN